MKKQILMALSATTLAFGLLTTSSTASFAQESGYDTSETPYAARINDLRTWCDNIAQDLKNIKWEVASTADSHAGKAQYLIDQAEALLTSQSPLGANWTPHTLDTLTAGLKFVKAIKAAAATQTGLPQRTKDKVVYRAITAVYDNAIAAYDNLDVPYYYSYVESCYNRNCDSWGNDSYFDGLRDLSINMLDLYSNASEALANDYMELKAAQSAADSAQFFLNASEFRRRFACQLNELGRIVSTVSRWAPANPSPEYSNAGAVIRVRDLIQDVRTRIAYPGCRYNGNYGRPRMSYR